MISAWKRFINKSDINNESISNGSLGHGPNGVPPGIQKLDKELQRKFARGVNYNMKVVIKGDARVGKSSLFLRLKGYGFDGNYNPTENLNVTSINWSYKTTDDIVKIDLWEAVDSTAKKSINYVDLKLENKHESTNEETSHTSTNNGNNNDIHMKDRDMKPTITSTTLSMNGCAVNPIPESAKQSLTELSENLDVYKGTDAVLLMLDMTKLWTFKYVQTELPKIPKNIPVLVVANFRDQGHHRTVSIEQIRAFIEGLDRTPCDGTIMCTEASMKNGFGLKLIEKFFNIPFLKLQETSLLKQLELNRCEYMSTFEELQLMQEAISKEYEQFLELETVKRRQLADSMSPVNAGLRELDDATREQIRNASVASDQVDKNRNVKSIESNPDKQTDAQIAASQNFINHRLPSIVIGAKCPLPDTKSINMTKSQHQQQVTIGNKESNEELSVPASLDDEDGSDSEDDEVPRANPMVAGYQNDLDSDDQVEN